MKKLFIFLLIFPSLALAKDYSVRLAAKSKVVSLQQLLNVVKKETGFTVETKDLIKLEERDLATSHFITWQQTIRAIPVKGKYLRLWTDLKTSNLIQFEAHISDDVPETKSLLTFSQSVSPEESRSKSLNLISDSSDNQVKKVEHQDYLNQGRLYREITVFAKRGRHQLVFALPKGKLAQQNYRPYPQEDLLEVPARAFQIWEENDERSVTDAKPVNVSLRYLLPTIQIAAQDPFTELAKQRYLDEMIDPVKALDPLYEAQGYWSPERLREKAKPYIESIPVFKNGYSQEGLLLYGKFASINVFPDAFQQFPGIQVPKQYSTLMALKWQPTPEDKDKWEAKPIAPLLGKLFQSQSEVDQIEIYRHPKHDPAYYLNNGFDQIQVYYAINQMFESLWGMGFRDPELATRRFDAFLYDPDIESQNNAYYHDDTINFTTYTADAPNYARDNTTIWHELGHGIMDRLMGPKLNLADTGGLSEGMADFVAQMVINQVTGGIDFPGRTTMRIFNKTGFYLTNEEHDDGEAYGGAMNDIMIGAIGKFGPIGIAKTSDLTMEAMRLCRNHPALTAQDWFHHMLYADSRDSQLRKAGELKKVILTALKSRNFSFSSEAPASLDISVDDKLMEMGGPGTRYNAIALKLAPQEQKDFKMKVELKNSSFYQFKYPVEVQIRFNKSPLQGAVHWREEKAGPLKATLNSKNDVASFDLSILGQCQNINTSDNGCKDYAHVMIFNAGAKSDDKPLAKKRFYVKINQPYN